MLITFSVVLLGLESFLSCTNEGLHFQLNLCTLLTNFFTVGYIMNLYSPLCFSSSHFLQFLLRTSGDLFLSGPQTFNSIVQCRLHIIGTPAPRRSILLQNILVFLQKIVPYGVDIDGCAMYCAIASTDVQPHCENTPCQNFMKSTCRVKFRTITSLHYAFHRAGKPRQACTSINSRINYFSAFCDP